eukprot:1533864-Pyramimonas_sp.AAC.1
MISNYPLPELSQRCDGSHEHVHLRGSNKVGSKTAQAAVYPDDLCRAILQTVQRISTTQRGGSISIQASHLSDFDMLQAIGAVLGELRVHAQRQGRLAAWDHIVTPWLRLHPQLQ